MPWSVPEAATAEIISMFSPAEAEACRRLIDLALAEDLGSVGDVTSQAIIPAESEGRAVFVVRVPGVVAGLPAAAMVCSAVGTRLHFDFLVADGKAVSPGERLARVSGPMRGILAAERTALNFLQRLSGVATRTRRFVEAVDGRSARILDTRKTTPGWRLVEKYAVRCGGGFNHRAGLYDAILIKDNHLAALGGDFTTVAAALEAFRKSSGQHLPVVIEVDSLQQLEKALTCLPDVVLLDNMKPDILREAVQRRNVLAPSVQLEASGGVNLSTVAAVADTGVDRISVGELTHSAPALDIALDYEAP
jgi:nicotinate-nucleotide pyrophosphorylase (carboxylating)